MALQEFLQRLPSETKKSLAEEFHSCRAHYIAMLQAFHSSDEFKEAAPRALAERCHDDFVRWAHDGIFDLGDLMAAVELAERIKRTLKCVNKLLGCVIHLVDGNWENLEVEVGEGEEPIWELEEYLVEMTWYNELLGNENRFSNALQGGTGLEEIMEEGPDL